MAIGVRMGIYAELDAITRLGWPSQRTATIRTRPLGASDAAAVDALWSAMADDLSLSVVGERDFSRLRHRYLEHPHKRYEVLMVDDPRRAGEPAGVIVLARDGAFAELVDLVGPLAHLPWLVAAARAGAFRLGAGELYAWITQSHRHLFVPTGAREEPTEIRVPTAIWGGYAPIPIARVRDRWWLMSGDSDFH
jgi:hypothetical protein